MPVSRELGEVTLLATVHHHISKVRAREAYLRWKVQLDAEIDGGTDAFQLVWGDIHFVAFLCSVHKRNMQPTMKHRLICTYLHRVTAGEEGN